MFDTSQLSPEALMEFKKLEAELATAGNTLNEKNKAIDDLQADNNLLVSKNDELKNELEGVMSINDKLTKLIEDAPAVTVEKKDTASINSISSEEFELDGETYGFAMPKIHYKRETITAEEILASEDLQRELVKMGSGMICKKVKEAQA